MPCRGLLMFIHIEYWMMWVSCQPKVQILLFASFLGFVAGLGFGIFRDLGLDLGLSTDISLRYSLPSSVFHCWQRAGLGASVVLLIHGWIENVAYVTEEHRTHNHNQGTSILRFTFLELLSEPKYYCVLSFFILLDRTIRSLRYNAISRWISKVAS